MHTRVRHGTTAGGTEGVMQPYAVMRSTRDMKLNYGSCKRNRAEVLTGPASMGKKSISRTQSWRRFPQFDLWGVFFWFFFGSITTQNATTGELLCNTTLGSNPSSVSSLLTSISLPASSQRSPHMLGKSEQIRCCPAGICGGSAVALKLGTPLYEPASIRSVNCCIRT